MRGLVPAAGAAVVMAAALASAHAVELTRGRPYVTEVDGCRLTLLFEETADNTVVSTTVQQGPDGRPIRSLAVLDPGKPVSVALAPLLRDDNAAVAPLTLRLTRRTTTVLAEIGHLLDNGHFALVERDT